MLPTWPISLLVRHTVSACARPALRSQVVSRRLMHSRSGLDSSAGEPVVAEARTRAAVHVAFMFVHSPDGDRGEPRGLHENQLQRRPLFHCLCHHSNDVERFAFDFLPGLPGSDSTIAREATLRPHAAFPFSASRQRSTLRPPQPARQGRPPNQERSCQYEERNVGQCLAARGVPHCHR